LGWHGKWAQDVFLKKRELFFMAVSLNSTSVFRVTALTECRASYMHK